ncbi:MAG TPA: DUF4386 domain-containing protein [Ktedonobacterales bacterium]|nr:DUF4386 domain-containing protein [Ktedonobacterales bacterium]
MQAQPGAKIEPGEAQVTKRKAGWSPRAKARVAGVFEALEGTGSTVGQVIILGSLVVAGNAAATAANILAHQPLFWLGFAASLLGVAFHLTWAVLFYELFKPVNRTIALLALCAVLVCCAMQALTGLLYLAPLLILNGGSALGGFTTAQVQALAFAFLKVNGQAFNVDLAFFGLWCVLSGYLIFRSTFMPRILGVLLMLDGVGWMLFMLPPVATFLFPVIAVDAGLAEIPLQLWLIVIGVNSERWKEQASAAGVSLRT